MDYSSKPFIAARIEDRLDARIEVFFRCLGWEDQVIGYTGYGNKKSIRIIGRVVLAPRTKDNPMLQAAEDFLARRGWRNFITAVVSRRKVNLTIGDQTIPSVTSRGGYIDMWVPNPGLAPGWHTITLQTISSEPVTTKVFIVGDDTEFGIITDIDDTVIKTWLPRPLVAAWNSFVLTEDRRQAVPGMAQLFHKCIAEHPNAPVFYLSTGAWNTYPFLKRFLARHRFPEGIFIMTDWGPTNTGWFRSGAAHKHQSLLSLTKIFPNIKWLLLGDDGQHDINLYSGFVAVAGSSVAAIGIRELAPLEQVLTHGTPTSLNTSPPPTIQGVPVVLAGDGRGLFAKLRQILPKGKTKNKDTDTK